MCALTVIKRSVVTPYSQFWNPGQGSDPQLFCCWAHETYLQKLLNLTSLHFVAKTRKKGSRLAQSKQMLKNILYTKQEMLTSDGHYFQAVPNVFTLILVHGMLLMITSTSIYGNHCIFSLKGGRGWAKLLCFLAWSGTALMLSYYMAYLLLLLGLANEFSP